jgi:ferredoxin
VKVHIDATKCDGYGTCAEIAPNLFNLDEWGFAYVAVEDELDGEAAVRAREAIIGCPRDAISELP